VEADPALTFGHSADSRDRYPEGGAFALAIGEAALLLRAEGMYLTQSIQRFDGSVPLVQGRDALLRVFLRADEENELSPPVRATFYNGGAVVHQIEVTSASPSVPLVIQEGLLARSWNAMIPGSVLQPGVSVVIEA